MKNKLRKIKLEGSFYQDKNKLIQGQNISNKFDLFLCKFKNSEWNDIAITIRKNQHEKEA